MPSDSLEMERIRTRLSDPDVVKTNAFQLLRDLCLYVSCHENDSDAHELVLRALDIRNSFGEAQIVLDGLVRQIGLFPYLEPNALTLADRIAYELHRPENMGEEIVFHGPQAHVYWTIL